MASECALFYGSGTQRGGALLGDNSISARAGSSEVIEVHHELAMARDAASGQATGRRRHGPLRVLKRKDRATVLLRQALVENDRFPQIELRWYRPDPGGSGGEQHFFSIFLRNAAVSKADSWLPNTVDTSLGREQPQEWIEFIYETVVWTWMVDNIEFEDSWHSAE